MQVGDLAICKSLGLSGDYRVYIGKGSWAGWGRFLLTDGTIVQVRFSEMEAVCK